MVALGVLGPAALAACSSNKQYGSSGSNSPAPAGGNQAGGALAKVADVPDGGGKVVTAPDGKPIVLVKNADGTVHAFSAKCTHMGVTVGAPQNGIITCPGHGSKFNAADGSVAGPPAPAPLPKVNVKVQGDSIVLA
jgi:Rieske Fe-S protein